MVRHEFRIEGMTCSHCVSAVTSALSALEGVSEVEVDLTSGQATVVSDAGVDQARVVAALDAAGYGVAS